MENTLKQTEKLSVKTKLVFGFGDFGLQVLTAFIQFCQLKYYTDICGIGSGLAGTAILVGKLTWDMVNDVLFGWVEDRTKSRWGRRRPYLMFCAIPLMLTFWLMLSLPADIGGKSKAIQFFAILGTALLFDTFSTLVTTAYSSMTAELTVDYDERTSLATYRMMFNIIGYLLGAAASFLLGGILMDALNCNAQVAYSIMGLIFGGLAALSSFVPGFFIKRKPAVDSEPTTIPPIKAMASVFKNKPFISLSIINLFMGCAFTVVTTVVAYYINNSLRLGDTEYLIVVGAMMVVLAVFIIPCSKVINRIGKAKTYALGLSIASVALISSIFVKNNGNSGALIGIVIVAAIAGLGFSSQWVCPHSMIPDVVEYDELLTGERREGIYYGMYGMVGKVSGALGSAIVGWVLALGGYNEYIAEIKTKSEAAGLTQTQYIVKNNIVASSELDLSIRFLFCILPAVLLLCCVPLLIKYPITKESHDKVVEELKAKKALKGKAE